MHKINKSLHLENYDTQEASADNNSHEIAEDKEDASTSRWRPPERTLTLEDTDDIGADTRPVINYASRNFWNGGGCKASAYHLAWGPIVRIAHRLGRTCREG